MTLAELNWQMIATIAVATCVGLLFIFFGVQIFWECRKFLRKKASQSPYGASTHELSCVCGSADCQGQSLIRRGFVEITKYGDDPETRWDYLYIESQNSDGSTEIMLPPEKAKKLMWWMIRNYFPGIALLSRMCRRVRWQLLHPAAKFFGRGIKRASRIIQRNK